MPAHRTAAEMQQDQIRFKNLIRDAEKQLINNGVRSRQAEEFLDPLSRLLQNATFWQHQSDGLAVFLSEKEFRYYRLPIHFQELLTVAKRFHLKPLLSLLSSDGRFYILAVSQNKVRLFQGTHFSISEMLPQDIPRSLADALKYDDPEKQLQFHTQTGGPGRRAAMFHGHGVNVDEAKDNVLRYFQQINASLHDILREERAPLVFAGVEYLLPIYREANTYSHLLDEGIRGNPDELSGAELHGKAWDIVQRVFRREEEDTAAQYGQLANTERVSDDLRVILPAAYHGRVDVLFVAVGLQQWGIFDPENNEMQLHSKPEADDADLLDLAAVQTMLHGGAVYAVPPERVPDNAMLAAIFRY